MDGRGVMKITSNTKSVTAWIGVLVSVVALVAAVAAVTAACGSGGGSGAAEEILLTQADNGRSFTAKIGDTITVVVPGNPTTGYQWEAELSEEAAALLTLEGEPAYEPDATGETLVGSGGEYTFTFTAAAAGQAELMLKYWRSFEPDVAPIDTFTASITIE
jgi:inhibitor of cysteine peptidase